MSDELPVAEQTVSDTPAQAEPAAPVTPEPVEPELPAFLNEPAQPQYGSMYQVPPQQQYVPPQQQYAPPQYVPPPQFQQPTYMPPQPQYQPPNVTADDLVNRPGEVISQAALQAVAPYVQRMTQADQFMQQVFASNLSGSVGAAREAIADGYTRVFAKDPSFGNKQVKATVDSLLKSQYDSAIQQAVQRGDFTGLNNFRNPKYMAMILAGAKIHVGYPGGQTPQAVNVQGAYTESSRSAPAAAATGVEITDELREAAARLRMEPEVLAKKIAEAEKQRKDLGW